MGFAHSKSLPIIFLTEDNGLAVLTPTSKRRSWKSDELIKGLGIESHVVDDNPDSIYEVLVGYDWRKPIYLHVQTSRLNRHVGARLEGIGKIDRFQYLKDYLESKLGSDRMKKLESDIDFKIRKLRGKFAI